MVSTPSLYKRNWFASLVHGILIVVRVADLYGLACFLTILIAPRAQFSIWLRRVWNLQGIDMFSAMNTALRGSLLDPQTTKVDYFFLSLLTMLSFVVSLICLVTHVKAVRKPTFLLCQTGVQKFTHLLPMACALVWVWMVVLISWLDSFNRKTATQGISRVAIIQSVNDVLDIPWQIKALCAVETAVFLFMAMEGNDVKRRVMRGGAKSGVFRYGSMLPFTEIPLSNAGSAGVSTSSPQSTQPCPLHQIKPSTPANGGLVISTPPTYPSLYGSMTGATPTSLYPQISVPPAYNITTPAFPPPPATVILGHVTMPSTTSYHNLDKVC